MTPATVNEVLAAHGIALPPDRLAEFERNHHDLRALVALIRTQPLDGDPWSPPASWTPEGGTP